MKNILIPVDFSDASNVALKYTAELARRINATVKLLHVHTPVVSRNNPMSYLITEERAHAEQEIAVKLKNLVDGLGERYSSVKWETIVQSGAITDVILSCAKNNVDLIAMGTGGVSSFEKAILGTNTADIIENSNCPVLAIPLSSKPYAPREILYATDYAPADWQSAKFLTEMAGMLNGTITYLHVTAAYHEGDMAKEREQINEFTNEIKKTTGFDRIKSKVISDHNVFMGLDSVLQDSNVDLLCLSTRKRSLMEKLYDPSVTRRMAIYTQVPLLAFKL